MKKLFPLFAVVLLLAGARGLWYFYNQPIEAGPVVQNGPSQKPPMAAPLDSYIARGTEPFWYFEYSGSTIVWQSPSNTGTVSITYSGITQTVSASGFNFNDGSGQFSATIAAGTCSDGMSEMTYTGTANVLITTGINQGIYKGCATW